ncbi:MAG: methyl-accepting chemotaxis protein [Mycobacteriales bacterium]|nr:methyl-accepting chemotaxis protein [Mycobacteriales bacterium]
MTTSTTTTLFDLLGGDDALILAVERFYEKVLADPELAPYFTGVDLGRLQERQVTFLAAALGGPKPYRGRSMSAVHADLSITQDHFDRTAGHLVDTLQELGIDEPTIGAVVAVVAPLAPSIVSSTGGTVTTIDEINGSLFEAGDAARYESMLENAPTNVMFADRDFVIRYMNPASLETLRTLQEHLPVAVDEIVGSSLDIFHKTPSYQRDLLSHDKKLPRRANIQVGPEILDLLVSPIYDKVGNHIGAMATWEVITDKLRLESEMARVSSMMENSPTNMMFADRDFVIRYMNPTSLETLRTLQEHLPVPVDEIVGSSLDIFHKTPAYQRGILSDDKNLPRRANIQVGPEVLDLLVSPISDKDGNYIGAMATWEVITQKLHLENEMARVSSMMENSPTNMMFADRDFVIRYMNPASLKTLKTLQGHLPIDADAIVGSSLDIFHKSPAYQRGILADDKNLPRRANIEVGPETLDLLVSPITDKDGNYIGAMATWEVITEQLRTAKAAEEAAADSAALSQVLAALATATTFEGATKVALDTVRAAFGWAYGSYWAVDQADQALKFQNESGDAGPEFHAVTLAATFKEGVGLSGRAWKSRDLFFTKDIGEMTDCVRAPVAQRVGVKSGVCFPILLQGEVVGTMDFFATETLEPSTGRLDALRNIGQMVSSALERIHKSDAEKDAQAVLQAKVDSILAVVTAAAGGDLTQDVTVSGTDAIGQMGTALQTFFTELRGSISAIGLNAQSLSSASEQLNGVSQQMGGAAEETATQAGVVSAAAEQVNVNVQTVAGGSEEMSASISEIAKNAADAARVAGQAVDVAGTANTTVAKLGESSAEIGKVIKVITSIAQQTNLLALNATIEAARAGEAGKGFAVVANEVKELAKETAKATEDISQKIEAIQGDTRGAVEAIEQISSIIGQINDIQSSIASAVEEQTATTNEIARNVSEAAHGSSEIAANITGVATAAQGTAKGAEETQRAAGELSQMAADLQHLVDRFTV